MPQVRRSALVSFSAEQMYDLVNDVPRYPEFLPGCAGAQVLESAADKMVASVEVSKAGIRKTFTTRNQLVEGTQIMMELVDGPFKSLRGGWYFTPLDEAACKVELKLDFEFTSKLVEAAFGRVFNELTNNMVSAFTKRAKQVY
jgi:ribosome-associated toxin RatA of RatAB toxin-antitoxin module